MIGWRSRARPLEPGALVAPRAVVPALHARLTVIDDERLRRLRGVATAEQWIIVGAADDLPWIEGLLYLARDPRAPTLYVPTYLELDPSAALVERAIGQRSSGAPWALFGTPPWLVSLATARTLDRGRLCEEARA